MSFFPRNSNRPFASGSSARNHTTRTASPHLPKNPTQPDRDLSLFLLSLAAHLCLLPSTLCQHRIPPFLADLPASATVSPPAPPNRRSLPWLAPRSRGAQPKSTQLFEPKLALSPSDDELLCATKPHPPPWLRRTAFTKYGQPNSTRLPAEHRSPTRGNSRK